MNFARTARLSLAALLMMAGLSAHAQIEAREGNPLWVSRPLIASGKGEVFGIARTNQGDIVVLDNGLDQGFRVGMHCQIERGELPIASIVLVKVLPDRAAGLIIDLEQGEAIHSGDSVRIQTRADRKN